MPAPDRERVLRKSLPRFKSLGKLVEFFETHDMGDYANDMPEVHFDVNIKRRTHLVAIDAERRKPERK